MPLSTSDCANEWITVTPPGGVPSTSGAMKTITAIWYVSRGHDRTKPIPYQVTPPPSDVLGIDKGAARSRAAKTAPSTWAPSEPGRDGADRTTTRYGDGMDEPALTASVVIPTHRGAQRLPRLLAALARQDFPGRWNVVVSVDGVVDDTLATIDRHRADLALVTVVEPTGRGVAAALNRGFEAADGDIIIRCDDDLTPRPDMVRRHVELHAREELLLVNAACRDVAVPTPFGRSYGSEAARRRRGMAYARPEDLRWIDCAAHVSLRASTWARAGQGYDVRLPYGEDSEMAYRLSQAGVRIHLAPELEIEHRGAPRLAANRVPRAFNAGAGQRLFAHLHPEAVIPSNGAPPATVKARLWAASVRVGAWTLRGPGAFRQVGRCLDSILPFLPRAVGFRAVAWAVETAGRSGHDHGPDDLFVLTGQKEHELRAEASSPR